MRSVLLTCSAILVLGVSAFAYLWFQPTASRRPANKILVQKPTSRPQSTTKISGLGTVDQAWIIRIDPKTGELASRFRGDRYDPQPDNTVLVDRPEAEFFAAGGKQRFHVTGNTGRVYVSGMAVNQKPGEFAGKMEPPTRGQLHDVTIGMFEPADSTEPVLTIRMNNAAFNNDELRVETESFTDVDGKRVDADQVPVTVRGRDYDFDGRGLVMKWNELDRRLQLLEIAHGEQLVIKNPKMLAKPEITSVQEPRSEATEELGAGGRVLVVREMATAKVLSAAKKPAKKASKRTTAPALAPHLGVAVHRDATPTVYRASFNDNVQVVQNGRQLALADVMHVNFLSDERKQSSAATQPGQSTTVPVATLPTTAPATTRAARDPSATERSTQQRKGSKQSAATKPTDGPITIKWTGKLRVVPIEAPATRPTNLSPGKPEVQFVGNPVTLMQERGKVLCAQATYNSGEGSADLRGSESIPLVRMTADTGMEVLTPHMLYSEPSPKLKYATLLGPSSAKLPVERAPGKDPFIHTKWTEQCKLRMVSDDANRTYIEHADLTGGVAVDDPDMNMSSDRMQLAFVPDPPKPKTPPLDKPADPGALAAAPAPARAPADPGSEPDEQVLNVQPTEIIAEGNVKAKLRDEQQREQTIAGNRLTLNTELGADGKRFARRFEVDGNVHSINRQGELTSEHLLALLKPSTRPTEKKTTDSQFGGGDVDLESLVADRNVRFATTQGAVATADTLKILDEQNLQRIHLLGSATRPATVVNQQSTISAERMRFTPDAQLAEIPCAGSMHAIPATNPAHPLTPRSVTLANINWQGGAVINGKTNLIDINDHVAVDMLQMDGTRNTATSDRLQATMVDRNKKEVSAEESAQSPTSQGSSVPAPTVQPATQPTAKGRASQDDVMGAKEISSATLSGNVEVDSELLAADASVLRGFNLFAETVTYDQVAQRLVVPVPGKMGYQDHRPAERGQPEGPTVGSGRGTTAFKWSKSLVYEGAERTATLTGDVVIVHKPQRNADQPFRIDAQTVKAEFEEAHPSTAPATAPSTNLSIASTNPSTGPTTAPAQENLAAKLITATDQVRVQSTKISFDAWELTYSPATSLLTAHGKPGAPGNIYNSDNGSTGIFDTLEWNTDTDQFKVTNARGRVRK